MIRCNAADYATRAAEQAIFRLAYAEAVEHFSRALRMTPADDSERRKLTLRRAVAFMAASHQIQDARRVDSAEAPPRHDRREIRSARRPA